MKTVSIKIDTTFKLEELISPSRLEFFQREGFKDSELDNQIIKDVYWYLLESNLAKSIPSNDIHITVD